MTKIVDDSGHGRDLATNMVRLDEVRDDAGVLTHKMCCICFEMMPLAELWIDPTGQRWDMCYRDGDVEQGWRP